MQMYVYLIHFKYKLHHAGHYIGFSKCLDFRSASHQAATYRREWRPITNLIRVNVVAVGLAFSSGMITDQIEEYASDGSGLQNLGNGSYQWNWKTPTTYANSCKTCKLDLGEGTGFEHLALFKFNR